MPFPPSVADLIERFTRNLQTYKSPDYNETRLRIEFLDPLFQSLGWDIANSSGYADAYKDVIHEDAIKVAGAGGGTKAPDYCFRIGGARKFFLEAKKPPIDIRRWGVWRTRRSGGAVKSQRGTAEVNGAFLEEIETSREITPSTVCGSNTQ